MSFTLNLGFGGLCLMVHDEANGQMYVLLPPCDHGDPHVQKLVYDEGAESQSQPTKIPVLVSLANCQIKLPATSQTPSLGRPPTEVANLTDLFTAHVPRRLILEDDTGDVVAARVRFADGTSTIAPCGGGDNWLFPNPTVTRLPIRVVWSIPVVGADWIDVSMTGINRFPILKMVRLFPDPATGTLDLWVFNSPEDSLPDELPPRTSQKTPPANTEADHFACYYTLTDVAGPNPLYDSPGPRIPPECFMPIGQPGLDAMCIAAQAKPQP